MRQVNIDLDGLLNLDEKKVIPLYSNPYSSEISLPLSDTSRFLGSYSEIQELLVNEGEIENEDAGFRDK